MQQPNCRGMLDARASKVGIDGLTISVPLCLRLKAWYQKHQSLSSHKPNSDGKLGPDIPNELRSPSNGSWRGSPHESTPWGFVFPAAADAMA